MKKTKKSFDNPEPVNFGMSGDELESGILNANSEIDVGFGRNSEVDMNGLAGWGASPRERPGLLHAPSLAQLTPNGRQVAAKLMVKYLDVPWTPPSWITASEYSNHYKPRRGGKGGSQFVFESTTSGRHCCLGGMGEQCDFWREGQTSEFTSYGPGITNYFKVSMFYLHAH